MLFMKRENVPLPPPSQRLYCVTEKSPENRVALMTFFFFRADSLSVSLRPAGTEVDCLKILCVLSPSAATAWRMTENRNTNKNQNYINKLCIKECSWVSQRRDNQTWDSFR